MADRMTARVEVVPMKLRATPLLPNSPASPESPSLTPKRARTPLELVRDAQVASGWSEQEFFCTGQGNTLGLLEIILTMPLDDLAELRRAAQ